MDMQTLLTLVGTIIGIGGLIIVAKQYSHSQTVDLRNRFLTGRSSGEFSASADDIWNVVANLEDWQNWAPGNLRFHPFKLENARVGTHVPFYNLNLESRAQKGSEVEIIKHQPPREIAIRFPSFHERHFVIEPVAQHPIKTKVTVTLKMNALDALWSLEDTSLNNKYLSWMNLPILNKAKKIDKIERARSYDATASRYISFLGERLQSLGIESLE